ncbi:MAG TPA: DUF4157 domain-containing protein [Candidatus Sulfotelmatobacter sp.]|nr:DUF4157 domain-containing protein [Candidatus Sulfotelmatobacter sp.]
MRSSQFVSENPFFGLQQTLGNQAMLRLLEAGVLRAKLRVSQPGDSDEQEADRVAEKVTSASHAPKIQRKCACSSGTPCAKCAGEDEETIHRSAAGALSRVPELSIQRAPAEQSATPEEPPAKTARHRHATRPLVIEDDAEKIEPHQMRKSQFLALLRTDACATADAVLISAGKSTKGCPYIEKWLAHYDKQSSSHIEAAMRKYAPETARARSAHEAIRLLLVRIQKAALSWAKTGKVEGLPPEMADEITGQKSLLEKVHDFASTAVAGAIFGFIGGKGKSQDSGTGGVMRKAQSAEPAPAHDAAAVRSQLGSGHSLDSRVQSQMSSAFGHDFSGVRVHTDTSAEKLSSDLQARAFTIGSDVAFASGEYRPGTLIGDALIAHELAHVVQQRRGGMADAPQRKSDDSALEQDADRAAAGAFACSSTQGLVGARSFWRGLAPTLRSGLRLSRCKDEKQKSEVRGKLLNDYAAKFPDAADVIRKSDAAVKLINEAEAAGTEFGGFAEDGPDKKAWPYTSGSKVYIAKGRPDKVVSASDFLFELNNAIRAPKYKEIGTQAAKGAAGGVTAKQYAYKIVEQEVEGMLRLGEVWVEMKKNAPAGEDWSKYDSEFFLSEYEDFKNKRKTKDDIIKDVLQRVRHHEPHPEWTTEQFYMDQFNSLSGGK